MLNIFGSRKLPAGSVIIEEAELTHLRAQNKLFEQLMDSAPLEMAQRVADNAKNVNQASTQRLNNVENSYLSIQSFIDQSSDIESISNESLKSAQNTAQISETGINQLNDLASNITSSSTYISEFTELLTSLDNNNRNIGQLVESIKGIAEQTKLLALNAAIEAARAGEHGRGFAVVADEVRSLANTANQSADQIQSEMTKIMDVSASIINKQKDVATIIEGSVTIADSTITNLQELVTMAQSSSDLVNETITQVQQQLSSSEEIKQSMEQIIDDTRQSIEGSAKNMELGEQLVAAFKK
jgi:methyl-accepting chemotaxis protein